MDTAADRAASGIRALIVSREYGPGDRLPAERDLAQRLGLSRPALREGIRRLRTGGLLESRRGSGTYVAKVDLGDVYDIRIRLEPLAAERAALRRSAAQLAEMQEIVWIMQTGFDDSAGYFKADRQFHYLVAQASRNPVLLGTLNRLAELVEVSRTIMWDDRYRRLGLEDVEKICAAIEREHPKRAANAMERHIAVIRDAYLSMIARERRNHAAALPTPLIDE